MAYNVNKTDGTTILVLDGTKDTTSTSITLIGRLVQNYGDATNENFVHLLENFSFTTSPANPIKGQLWYDANTTVENIKVYDGTSWVTVGSNINGNVDVQGNLTVGGGGNLEIKELSGLVHINNTNNNGNIAFFANVNGTSTNVLNIQGNTGLITVLANATSNMGVTTKVYVDSVDAHNRYDANVAITANVATINANLVARISEESQLRANITAANVEIDTTQANVGSYQTFSNTRADSTSANLGTVVGTTVPGINANVGAFQTYANTSITTINNNITGANTSISTLSGRLDSVNLAQTAALSANINLKADTAGPTFTGTPVAPTATFGANTTQIATTQYVMTRGVFWDGSRKFVSTADPTVSDGADGDIWFKYTP
jgi:hypothetical protein